MNSDYFIKGPIPLPWLTKANRLGGSTGTIAVVLWFYDGMSKGQPFKVGWRLDYVSGVSRQARQRSLKKLADAGLIHLNLRQCAFPMVSIIK